jgi:uncharacterized membrane protein YcaP (DUF421 family)
VDGLSFLFDSGRSLARIALVGALSYVALVALLRAAGKHSLAKANAYGLVITVALGSTLASAVLTKEVTLADGTLAIVLLLGLQFLFSTLISRYPWAARYLTASPALLVRHGELVEDQLRRERVTKAEIRAAVRGAGLARIEDALAVVLETDGSLSVIPEGTTAGSALADVEPPFSHDERRRTDHADVTPPRPTGRPVAQHPEDSL